MTIVRAIAVCKAAIKLLEKERGNLSEEFREAYEVLGDMHQKELNKEIKAEVREERKARNA